MYREMTPEEKLDYSAEIIEAIKKGGLIASLEVVDKYKIILSKNTETKPPQEDKNIEIHTNEHTDSNINNHDIEGVSQDVSIYAPEHISDVQADLQEQQSINVDKKTNDETPKTRILEVQKNHTPNPWGDAKIVSPGQLEL